MNEADVRDLIIEALEQDEETRYRMRSFQQEGIMTYNEGLVLKTEDGEEFQITIVRSR